MKRTPEQEIEEMKKHLAELEKMVGQEQAQKDVEQKDEQKSEQNTGYKKILDKCVCFIKSLSKVQIVFVLLALLLIAFVVRYNWIGEERRDATVGCIAVLDGAYDRGLEGDLNEYRVYNSIEICLDNYGKIRRFTKDELIEKKMLDAKRLFWSRKQDSSYINEHTRKELLEIRNEFADYVRFPRRDERVGSGITVKY